MSRFTSLLCIVSVNRGKILEDYVRGEQVNITKLSDKLPWTVKTVYRHFTEEDLPYDKLIEYAHALKYDFKDELPGLQPLLNRFSDHPVEYKRVKQSDNDAEYYRLKYEVLLEKYNEILIKHNELLRNLINEK